MILRLTVRDGGTGTSRDVEVVAEPDSSVASLLAALPLPVGGRPCHVDGVILSPQASIGDSPLVAGSVITIGYPAAARPTRAESSAGGTFRAVSGPDAGFAVDLPPGSYEIGRAATAAIRLTDTEVSRVHARLTVTADSRLTITDLSSANGTAVNGTWLLQDSAVPVAAHDVVELAGGQFEWLPKSATRPIVTRSRDGRLDFDRAFAPAPAVVPVQVKAPTQQTARRGFASLIASGLAPVGLGIVMAAVMRQPLMLLFALSSPLVIGATHLVERRQRRAQDKKYDDAVAAAQQRIDHAVHNEQRVLRQLAPDRNEIMQMATSAQRGLWPRNAVAPDALVLRVGTTDQPTTVEIQGDPWPGFTEPVVRDVPVTVDLRQIGVLGLVGPSEPVDALAAWLMMQLATLRGPDDLRMVVLTSRDGRRFAWTQWLPQTDTGEAGAMPCWIGNTPQTRAARVENLKNLVEERKRHRTGSGQVHFDTDVVVLLEGALALRNLPGMKEILRDGPTVGVYALCADSQDMNECRGLCRFDNDPAKLWLTRSRSEHPLLARAEGVDALTAEHTARALAPMRDRLTLSGGQVAMPYPVRLVDLFEPDVHTTEGVIALWAAQPGPTTQILLGADASGTVSVDLARQGPHTMLAGATGAGKSVLLQTLVTALLLSNRPDELNLVLVDFKGGGAFLPFQHCPHVVSLILSTGKTPADVFDATAAARVLASVRSEVNRRESWLAEYEGELDNYWRARRSNPALKPLPRLVMIFDEFARVLETSPEFLKELVNVAAKGRSLGMHLVLATQSLQGKLSAELKNNISLRITLRQNEPAESTEVLGVPDAASIPGRLRGRGMILSTNDEIRTPRLFQSGYLGDPPPTAGAAPAAVRVIDWITLGDPRPQEKPERSDQPTDLDRAIAAVTGAADKLGLTAPFQPLKPPLPAVLPLSVVTADRDTLIPFGLTDDPVAQAQPTAVLDLAGTDRLMVAGGPQSGRTTFARSLITSLATRTSPNQVHLYIVERLPDGLAAYSRLPHCGGVFGPAEPDRLRRLVAWLHTETERRTAARYSDPGSLGPKIVIMIDGWEIIEDRDNPAFTESSTLSRLREVIATGTPLGIHVVAIGGEAMMKGNLPNLYSRRLLLSFPKEETRRQHLGPGLANTTPPVLPGRAVDAASGLHTHICQPDTAPNLTAPVGRTHPPRAFPPLPATVRVEDLEPPTPTWLPIGLGGMDVTTIAVDLYDAGPHLMLVSGPAGSGRTTAAATLAHQLHRAGSTILALAPPRSPLARLLPADPAVRLLTGTTFKDTDLRSAAQDLGQGRLAVILDDCEQITIVATQEGFSDAPTLLQDITNPGALGRQALILCGNAAPILEGQRRSLSRVAAEIMTAGTRILFTPTNAPTARLHSFTLEPDQYFGGPPGRGYLTAGPAPALIQLAREGL